MKDGEYTTADLRKTIATWRQLRGFVAPSEALEVAAALEVILDAAERLFATVGRVDLTTQERDMKKMWDMLDLREAIGDWVDDPQEAEKGKGKS